LRQSKAKSTLGNNLFNKLLSQFQNATSWPISALGSNLNPRNTKGIPVVEIFSRLELDQTETF